MENLVLTANIVFPLFLVMLTGFAARCMGLITDSTVKGCNKIVFRIFLPLSLARSIMRVDASASIPGTLFIYIVLGTVMTFALGMLIVPRFEKNNKRRGVIIQGLFRSNYAIFGIPLTEALYPQGDGGIAAMMVLAVIPTFNVLAVITLETYCGGKLDFKRIALGVLKNPLIWGCLFGFVMMKTGWELPAVLDSAFNKLADIASPLALFVLGASLQPSTFRENIKALSVMVPVRLIVAPVILLGAAYLLGWRGPAFAALLITFAAPAATSSFTMAEQMGGDSDLAAQHVVLTTLLSAVTIFVMVFLLKTWGVL